MTPGGYFAVSRGIFEHPVFVKHPDWVVPFQRLIAKAAWKPEGVRLSAGVIALARGQLASTHRELAALLDWPKTTLVRFLRGLEREGMLTCEQTKQSGPSSGPNTGPSFSHRATLITICNYDKFQKPSTSHKSKADQIPDQIPDQVQPQLPGFVAEKAAEPLNQRNHRIEDGKTPFGGKGSASRRAHCPPDGATNEKMVFGRVGCEYWQMYSSDYRQVRGAEPLPVRYDDGHSGLWFFKQGEASGPARRQFRRRA